MAALIVAFPRLGGLGAESRLRKDLGPVGVIQMLVPCRATFASAVSSIAAGSARLPQWSRTRVARITVGTYLPDKGS
jgi:hypothetical protein